MAEWPLDRLQPYRLEMGTRLANAHGADLYAFWGRTVSDHLNQRLAEARMSAVDGGAAVTTLGLDAFRRFVPESGRGAVYEVANRLAPKLTAIAAELGFDRPAANSIDAVSDRDFALDYLASAAICAVHLSRLAEELVLWSTPQFGFVRMPEAFTSGSSALSRSSSTLADTGSWSPKSTTVQRRPIRLVSRAARLQ